MRVCLIVVPPVTNTHYNSCIAYWISLSVTPDCLSDCKWGKGIHMRLILITDSPTVIKKNFSPFTFLFLDRYCHYLRVLICHSHSISHSCCLGWDKLTYIGKKFSVIKYLFGFLRFIKRRIAIKNVNEKFVGVFFRMVYKSVVLLLFWVYSDQDSHLEA